ncbi:hypothetical protein MW887_010538 [Aspergillus wentii]|nr:hypothetical protein MW887_010538 [Aspergillus wentii]
MTNPSFQVRRAEFSRSLKRFTASSTNFQILSSVPSSTEAQPPPPDVLYVLDSSYNPPTHAHLRIASSALLENSSRLPRLLLLLATQNADKPPKPALFEDRLIMMELFARDLLSYMKTTAPSQPAPQIDIGVTKMPYFIGKAAEIDSAGVYPKSLEQVHLTGYDTLIRIFDTKYYPPEQTLHPLQPFISQHRLRVTMRPNDEWGNKEEQEAFLLNLAQGGREHEGGKREWAERIQFVEGKKPGERPVSSTLAREASQRNPQDLEWLVPEKVRGFLSSQQPYTDN